MVNKETMLYMCAGTTQGSWLRFSDRSPGASAPARALGGKRG